MLRMPGVELLNSIVTKREDAKKSSDLSDFSEYRPY